MDPTASRFLIRGGTIIDGTGAAARPGDVRVHDGQIVEVGTDLVAADGDHVVDASGCVVAPGFIESHTHLDGMIWWNDTLDPLPGNGVTTVVMGNCGFALAPLNDDPAVRDEVVGIFTFFEDFPTGPFRSHVPWSWRTWPEYRDAMTGNVSLPVNYGAFVGHIALRLAVLGTDAWSRAATPAEIDQMAGMLDDALAAGALGLSSNLMDHDGSDRPVPSLHADDAEFRALLEVLARRPGVTMQVVVDSLMRVTALASVQRLARLAEGLDVRVQWAGVPTLKWQKRAGFQQPLAELHDQLVAEGRDFWTGFAHNSITTVASIEYSLLFAQSNDYVWHEVVQADSEAAKLALLTDPEWRARARHSWDHEVLRASLFARPRGVMLDNSANETGPVDVTLGDYADSLGLHPSDALAEWFVHNGVTSTITMPPWPKDDEMVVQLIRDPKSVGNISDVGAHGQMFCGIGYNLLLFTQYVREGLITLEEAVHVQTGKLADHFGLSDRGVVAAGKRADLVVFDPAEVEFRPTHKVYDVPDGEGGMTWRWTRDAAPMRLTLVNGTVTFDGRASTGAKPGIMVSPV